MAKKLFTKVIAMILLLSMMLTLAVACGDSETTTKKPGDSTAPTTENKVPGTGPEGTTPSTPSDTTPIEYPVQLDGIKEHLEDTTVQFVYVEGSSGTYTADSIWIDEETAGEIDAVDQQIIDRNNRIYEDLGVSIEAFTDPTLGISGLQTFAKTYFDVQDPGLDVYCGYQYYDLKTALSGHLLNLNTIVNENQESLIDITQPYWATNYINSITYNDLLFWVTGDLALRFTGGLYCTFVNLDLYDMYVKNNYDGKSIYDIVNEKKWTMQTMLDMADMVDDDTDQNGKASAGDRLGIVFEPNDVLDGLAFGCKISFTSRTIESGKDVISIALNNDERAVKLADYINTMFKSLYAYNAGDADSANMMPLFAEGNTLFAFNKIYQSSVYLSGMERFAIVPTPMLDENQADYASGAHDGLTIFGISKYSNCPIASAATLELMAYYGSLLVTPTYVESVLKGSETIHDPESIAMIDKIRAGFDSDFGAAWSEKVSNIVHVYRSESSVSKFASVIKISSRQWPSELKKLLTELEEVAAEQ
ncbi:MAG: hypothetical protein IJD35_00555 [Clostridia bacterium]|nr:hypothetical protein [Clostridia bacterium]